MSFIGLSETSLFRLYPAAMLVSPAFTIRSFGPVASACAPAMRPGQRLLEFFDIIPGLENDSLFALASTQQTMKLVTKQHGIRLDGLVFATESDYLIVMETTMLEATCLDQDLPITDFPDSATQERIPRQNAPILGLKDDSDGAASDAQLAWEENGAILGQMRLITGSVAHEFGNLLSIIQLSCKRLISRGAIRTNTSQTIRLIQETAKAGRLVSKWLRSISGHDDPLYREPLDDFLRANLSLLVALCGPSVAVSVQLSANGASLGASASDLLTSLINLVRMASAQGDTELNANISTILAEALEDDLRMVQLAIRLEANQAIDGAALLTCKHPPLLRHQNRNASISEFAAAVGGCAQHETIGENTVVITLRIPCMTELAGVGEPFYADVNRTVEGGRHLIVVEDEVEALEALVELLEYEGFAITACGNADEALAALAVQADAVLVTDVKLPTIDGLTLAQAATAAHPLLKVIFMSGHSPDMEHSDKGWVFLQKPIDINDLIGAIMQTGE